MRAADGIGAGHRELLLQAYAAIDAQDVEALLARDQRRRRLARRRGKTAWQGAGARLRTEQWTRTRTHDEPLSFRAAVYIRQVVRSLYGSPISRGHFLHMHRIEGDLISRMHIICQRFLRAF